jgi:hypothetical protein
MARKFIGAKKDGFSTVIYTEAVAMAIEMFPFPTRPVRVFTAKTQ